MRPIKAVILAGGRGSRLSEETQVRPKPMVEIGGRPILWHLMKLYAHFGVHDFIVCLGYRGYVIKEYFANYFMHNSDITVDLATNELVHHATKAESWRVTLVDTGEDTLTGGRLRRVRDHLAPDEPFYATYGDGLASIDLDAERRFHEGHGLLATMTVVRPPARFGSARVEGDRVAAFEEKSQASSGMINGGFFILSPKVLDRISGDDVALEQAPLEELARDGQLAAWRHEGFWHPMDTLRDRDLLEALWASGQAPWRLWR